MPRRLRVARLRRLTMEAVPGEFEWAGFNADFTYARHFSLETIPGAFQWSGFSATLTRQAYFLRALSGSFLMTGRDATLTELQPINLAWDANPAGENVTAYKLYYGSITGVYTSNFSMGNVTTYVLPNPGVTRYYAITAVNADGESTFSNEITAG